MYFLISFTVLSIKYIASKLHLRRAPMLMKDSIISDFKGLGSFTIIISTRSAILFQLILCIPNDSSHSISKQKFNANKIT